MGKGRVLFAVVATTVVAGTLSAVSAAASGGGGPVAQSVLGSGSDTTQFMMHDMDRLYQFSPGCSQIPTPAGPAAWLDFSCQSPDSNSPITTTGTSTTGSPTVTTASTSGLIVGQLVTGPGVPSASWPQGVYVGAIVSNMSFSLSSSPVSNDAVNADGTAGTGTFDFYNVTKTENYEHDQLTEAYFLGSSNGIHQVCQQGNAGVAAVSFARSSRIPKIGVSGADCTGLHFVAYAQDGIPWEAYNITGGGAHKMKNTAAPCTTTSGACLTLAQLQGIYTTCTITNWNQVGGANVPIDPYTPQSGSGTRYQWDTFLGGDSSTCINAKGATYANAHIIPENSNAPIVANGDTKNAIFPFSFGIWSTQVKGAGKTELGKINNIAATGGTTGTIANGTFPSIRNLFNVFCAAVPGTAGSCGANSIVATQPTINYVGEEGWICKPAAGVAHSTTLTGHVNDPITGVNYATEIQNAILNNGFVPIANGTIGGGDNNQDNCRLFTT